MLTLQLLSHLNQLLPLLHCLLQCFVEHLDIVLTLFQCRSEVYCLLVLHFKLLHELLLLLLVDSVAFFHFVYLSVYLREVVPQVAQFLCSVPAQFIQSLQLLVYLHSHTLYLCNLAFAARYAFLQNTDIWLYCVIIRLALLKPAFQTVSMQFVLVCHTVLLINSSLYTPQVHFNLQHCRLHLLVLLAVFIHLFLEILMIIN